MSLLLFFQNTLKQIILFQQFHISLYTFTWILLLSNKWDRSKWITYDAAEISTFNWKCLNFTPLIAKLKKKKNNFKGHCVPSFLIWYIYYEWWHKSSVLRIYLLSQKSHGKGRSSQWRNLMWIFRAANVVQVMSQNGHFTWFTGSKRYEAVITKNTCQDY